VEVDASPKPGRQVFVGLSLSEYILLLRVRLTAKAKYVVFTNSNRKGDAT